MLVKSRGIGFALSAALVGVGAASSGCGGDDANTEPTAQIKSVPTTAAQTRPKAAREPRDGRKPGGSRRGGTAAARQPRDEAIRDAVARLPKRKRNAVLARVVRGVLDRFGFARAQTSITSPNAVRVVVRASEACGATPRTQFNVAEMIAKGVPGVDRVNLNVGSTGQSLTEYVKRHCSNRLPTGRGRVVLTQRGTGMGTTASFRVNSPRWTVEYLNVGRFMQIIPMSTEGPAFGAVSVSRRGAGRRIMKGDGTFKLQIGSVSEWVIRVRDGV